MNITRPEMIIFDYGHTLLCEPDWNSDRGNADLMKYIIKNPNNCTLNDIRIETQKVFGEIENVRKTFGYAPKVEESADICTKAIRLNLCP